MTHIQRDRVDAEIVDEIKGLVSRYGLHAAWKIHGQRCCTMDEVEAAARHEARQRREHGSTNMIVTTGNGPSPSGVFLPPAPSTE